MKVVAIVQARLGSTRFPEKVLKKILNKPMLIILLKRLSLAKTLNKIIVAIPKNKKNNKLGALIKKNKFSCFRGSELNVLERYYKTAKKYKADIIVRVTSDNPLTDPNLIDKIVSKLKKEKRDYVNSSFPNYPLGIGAEAFTFKAISKIIHLAKSKYHKEHVTSYFRANKKNYKISKLDGLKVYAKYRLTIDVPLDFKVVESIFNFFKPDISFNFKKIVKLFKKNPKLFLDNKHIIQNK